MAHQSGAPVDPRCGYCASTGVFHSKRQSVSLPSDPRLSVTAFLSSRRHSGSTALIDAASGRRLSYADLWRSVAALARSLSSSPNLSLSLRHGDVVLLLSPNSIHFPVVTLAVLSLGAVLTTTNPLNTPGEIAKQVSASSPAVAFTTRALVPKLSSFPTLPIVLLEDDLTDSDDRRVVAKIGDLTAIEPDRRGVRGSAAVSQDDPATILYSSGTTGDSKGVVATHRNLISMAQIIMHRFELDLPADGEPETFICTVPMFHVYGLAAFALGLLGSGSTVVIISKFDLEEMVRAINEYKATYLPLVPPILVAMLNQARALPLGRLRRMLSGGAPLGRELIEGFRERYPTVEILQGYGLTETAGMGASTDSAEESRRYGTAGLLSPNTEGRIVDPDTGVSLPPTRTGELWIRAPYVMKGYFKNPEATRAMLDTNGWLRTGDLCYIDNDGYLFVVDRLKELIKYKGYQVPPAELEALLLTHPEIADAAVIPFPDKQVGQYPMAYVVRKDGSNLSETAVMDFVGRQVAPYKKIRKVAFVSTIPKNPSGKILRKDLIKMATSKL